MARFYALEKLINLTDDYAKQFKIDEHSFLLIQLAGELQLIEANCPHQGHPLSHADVLDNKLRCPLHGYQFDIQSGRLMHYTEEPCRALKRFELIYRDTEVGIML